MGLFGGKKKICSFCGGKSGLLGYKLQGEDNYLCADCARKCRPGTKNYKSMTVQDVEQDMAIAAENRRLGQEVFQATREFFTGSYHNRPVLAVDEANGWFMNTAKKDGWVYNLSDISNYNMRIRSVKDDKKKDAGLLEILFSPSFYSGYPELPRVPYNEKLTGAYLTIHMLSNILGEDTIEIDVMPGFLDSEMDIRAAYECCHQFYEFMNDWRANNRGNNFGNNGNNFNNYGNNGGFDANTRSAVGGFQEEAPKADVVETLTKLKGLVDAGILTEAEFDAKKKQLLGL